MRTGIIVCVVCLAVMGVSIGNSPMPMPTPENVTWEYGVLRVRAGDHTFEWQDRSRRVFAQRQSVFLEKLGWSRVNWALDKMNTEEAAPYREYVVIQGLINELGQLGWEMVEVKQEQGREVYWFKRAVVKVSTPTRKTR